MDIAILVGYNLKYVRIVTAHLRATAINPYSDFFTQDSLSKLQFLIKFVVLNLAAYCGTCLNNYGT